MGYAELSVTSNFTFLTGASHAEEYVVRAADLGLSAIAVTDRNTFAGIVRAHAAAKEVGLRYLVGVRLCFKDIPDILAYPTDRAAYGRLSRLLTLGKRRTTKGKCELYFDDVLDWGEGCVLILTEKLPTRKAKQLNAKFKGYIYQGMAPRYDGRDKARFADCATQAETTDLPLVALGDVLMHVAERRRLADVLSCIRAKTTIDKLGRLAQPNAATPVLSAWMN